MNECVWNIGGMILTEEKAKYAVEKTCPSANFFHQKSYMYRPGTEPGPPR
jgi:hypothetical protein